MLLPSFAKMAGEQKRGPRRDPFQMRRHASAPRLRLFYQTADEMSRYMARAWTNMQNRMILTILYTPGRRGTTGQPRPAAFMRIRIAIIIIAICIRAGLI
jgi:hypothetical protein